MAKHRFNPASLRFYAYLDPGSGKQEHELKKLAARSALVVVAVTPMSHILVPFSWAARVSSVEIVRKILEVNQMFRPIRFGIEASAQQSLFSSLTRAWAREVKQQLPLVNIYQPTKVKKVFRIQTEIQPVLAHGRLVIGPGNLELRNELRTFPNHPVMDLVDALGTCIRELVPQVVETVQRRTEQDAYLEYLRMSGASVSVIEQASRDGFSHHFSEQPRRQTMADRYIGVR